MTWRYFSIDEFACQHCGENLILPTFVDKLDELRHRTGFPFLINSGYRCPVHNAKVSSTGRTGPHTTGRAVDGRVDRGRAYVVLRHAFELGFTGVGVQQKGQGRFIHLDDLPDAPGQPRPTVWSY